MESSPLEPPAQFLRRKKKKKNSPGGLERGKHTGGLLTQALSSILHHPDKEAPLCLLLLLFFYKDLKPLGARLP